MIARFDTLASLNAWMRSDDRVDLLQEVQQYISEPRPEPEVVNSDAVDVTTPRLAPGNAAFAFPGPSAAPLIPTGPPSKWKVVLLLYIQVCFLVVFWCSGLPSL